MADGKTCKTLADIRAAHPDLTRQENGALQDIAYGVQRYAGSLRLCWRGKCSTSPSTTPS